MDCDFEDKYVMMHNALEQDFDELQAEAAAVATLLQQSKEKQHRLQDEIKFLKKRASMLRGSLRFTDPYSTREAVGDGAQYVFGPSRILAGRMAKAMDTTSVNLFHRSPSYSLPSSKHISDVVGVLRTSSRQDANGIVQPTRVGKRKISWQNEYSVKG